MTRFLTLLAAILVFIAPGAASAQSITVLQADKIIANTSLTSPVATIPAITAHGLGNVISNTALGNSVFNSATTGTGNVGIGSFALQNIGADQQNTAVGVDAFNACAGSCAYGTAVGWGAGISNLNGYGTFIGYDAGLGITTGTYNTIVGTSAFNTGSGITTGANNTILGAQVTGLAAGTTNNIILANGTGAIKAQHDGTNWTFTGQIGGTTALLTGTVGIGGEVTVDNTGGSKGITFNTGARIYREDATTGELRIAQSSTDYFGISTAGHFRTINTTPTIANGACGAGANGTISGTDQSGKITIAGAATASCAVSFGVAFATAPQSCTFSPATAASAAVQAYVSAITVNGFTLSATALATTSWYYHCF